MIKIAINWSPIVNIDRPKLVSEINRINSFISSYGFNLKLEELNYANRYLESVLAKFKDWAIYDQELDKDSKYRTKELIKKGFGIIKGFKEFHKKKNLLISKIEKNIEELNNRDFDKDILRNVIRVSETIKEDILNNYQHLGLQEYHISDLIELNMTFINLANKKLKKTVSN